MLSYNAFYFISPALLPNQLSIGASVADQIKVNYFYGTPWLFLLVSALVPTVAYAGSLYAEMRTRRSSEKAASENV